MDYELAVTTKNTTPEFNISHSLDRCDSVRSKEME
jgi:hypothetical protein